MKSALVLTTLALALMVPSCGARADIQVSTTAAPNRDLSSLRTFRVLKAPERRPDAPKLPDTDPMLTNSITNAQLRAQLVQAFEERGYAENIDQPDFLVAYYAGTREKHDTTYWAPDPMWTYGYWGYGRRAALYRSAWPWYGYSSPYPAMSVREYTEGSVIVDVVDTATRELIWRGQAVAPVSNNPEKYMQHVGKAVRRILDRFPVPGAVTAGGS